MSRSRLAQHHSQIRDWVSEGKTRLEVAKLLGVDESVARRYINRHVLANGAEVAGPKALLQEVNEVDILRAERDELRAALTRNRKADVAEERIIRAVEEQLALGNVRYTIPPQDWDVTAADDDAHHRQVLLLSDFHGGEVVDPEVVNGLNAYSWAIMEGRVDELIARVLKWKQRSPELTGLDILFIGDMCSGSNHDELAVTNEYVLAEQAVRIGYLMASIIERLAPHYPDVRVGVVEGNHPRLSKKPAAKNPQDNGDWIAGVLCREATKHLPNLSKFEVGRGSLFWEVAGRTVYVMHGDGIRSTMPGVPWGGVMRRTDQLAKTYRNRNIDHFVLGHFHQANVVQLGRIVMNGSLKGADEWCLKNFGSGEPPCQLLLEFDEKGQRMTVPRFVTPTYGLPGA